MRVAITAALVVALALPTGAAGHLVTRPKDDTLASRSASQSTNLKHARYVCRHGARAHKRWACAAVVWLERELGETRAAMRPRLAWRQTVAAWLPTYYCERGPGGWATNTGNGFYGGLQFDYGTWQAHGGQEFAVTADKATPAQQALVASRLTYDGWPNCPNP